MMHQLYPDSWFNEGDCDERCALSFTEEYIKAHLNTKVLEMPVLLEEFGKEREGKKSPYEVRNKFIEKVYGKFLLFEVGRLIMPISRRI